MQPSSPNREPSLTPSRKPVAGSATDPDRRIDWARWLISPRSAVFVFLALVLGVGGWRRFSQARKARALADRIGGEAAGVDEIEQASQFGRASLIELFQTLELPESDARRQAAGRACNIQGPSHRTGPPRGRGTRLDP